VRRKGLACLFVFAVVGLSACASDPRPKYVAPAIAGDQIVTIKTTNGMFVDSIDGAKVDSAGVNVMGVLGGNTVKVSPGQHTIGVWIKMDFNKSRFTVTYTFDSGTEYAVGPDNSWNAQHVKITNLKTKTSVLLQ
jgi:hypothetical protein